jgi:hypothetical protein
LEDHRCTGLEDVSTTNNDIPESRSWLLGLFGIVGSDDGIDADMFALTRSARKKLTKPTPHSSTPSGPRSSRAYDDKMRNKKMARRRRCKLARSKAHPLPKIPLQA